MSFAAAAAAIGIGGGAIVSSLIGSNAAKTAASQQVGVEQQGLSLQENALSRLSPFIGAGTNALSTIGKLYGSNADYSQFYNSPDYKFAQEQGNLGVQRYENANGLALSGGALKDIATFNQGLASQQFGNYFNRLMSLASLGSNSANAGVTGTNAAAGTLGNIGASAAGGTVGSANAITGGINSGTSNMLLYNAINRNQNNPNGVNPSAYGTTQPSPIGWAPAISMG